MVLTEFLLIFMLIMSNTLKQQHRSFTHTPESKTKIFNTFITAKQGIYVSESMLLKVWQGLYLLMCIFTLIYSMYYTMKYNIATFSHILVHSSFRIFGLARMRRLSEPNIISTNGSSDYFHHFPSNEMRAFKIEQEQLSAVQDPEPLSVQVTIVMFSLSPLARLSPCVAKLFPGLQQQYVGDETITFSWIFLNSRST